MIYQTSHISQISYWLNVVEMLSNASPLLIVQNDKQNRTRDINLSALRARFGNLRGALATNLDTNRGLDGVIQAIQKELESLPHVGVGLPATWKRVREALEQDPRDYIGLDWCGRRGWCSNGTAPGRKSSRTIPCGGFVCGSAVRTPPGCWRL